MHCESAGRKYGWIFTGPRGMGGLSSVSGATVRRRLSWVSWDLGFISRTCFSHCLQPVVLEFNFPSVVCGKGCASYMVCNHLRNYPTYFILFCNGVNQEICSNIVNIWNQNWWILWNTVSRIKIWLKFLIPVLPITYAGSKNSSS